MNSNPDFAPLRRRLMAGGLAAAGTALAAASAGSHAQTQTPARSDAKGRFNGKVVLITGGTSGIGKATAEAFAREGAKVAFCGRREALGRQVEAGIRALGGEAMYMRADVREPAQVKAFVDAVAAKYGRIDIALNNAGNDLPPKPIADTSIEAYDDLMNTHARGVFVAMKHELPLMVKQGGGQIVNTASIGAHNAYPGVAPYTAAKAAVVHLTKSAAVEYGDKGVRVLSISPGWVDTPMMDRALKDWGIPDKQTATAATPLKRAATPQEIAETVMFLVGNQAAYVSGTDLLIAGGWQG